MKRTLKAVVPLDDQWHDIDGPIVHVEEQYGHVTVWFEHDDEATDQARTVRAFATGQPLPEEPTAHVGTAVIRDAWTTVWHVRELVPVPAEIEPTEPTYEEARVGREPTYAINITTADDVDLVAVGREVTRAIKAYEAHGGSTR